MYCVGTVRGSVEMDLRTSKSIKEIALIAKAATERLVALDYWSSAVLVSQSKDWLPTATMVGFSRSFSSQAS